MKTEKIGVKAVDILLPSEGIDFYKWAVIACDQYTSQPEYWKRVFDIVGDNYSTLKLIFPEVFLDEEEKKKDERIDKINKTMKNYLNNNILVNHKSSMIYLERKNSHSVSRKGLIFAVDLEKYDYNKGSQTFIRATEGTVLDRIPPRLKVRENAAIELPHIMLLIDDLERSVIEPIGLILKELEKVYDTDLMMNGGHITGYQINQEKIINQILSRLRKLTDRDIFNKKYGVDEKYGILLFATGDGNHSLATAKAHWERIKIGLSTDDKKSHPSRFALVEVVNIHDKGLTFEPIHRIVFGVDSKKMLENMKEYLYKNGSKTEIIFCGSKDKMKDEISRLNNKDAHIISFVFNGGYGFMIIKNPIFNLEVGTLQNYLDQFIEGKPNVKIDYVHGKKIVNKIGSKENNIGFYLPVMDKKDLFKTVIVDGSLPRKTFSMGEAEEKRFYFESRKIIK